MYTLKVKKLSKAAIMPSYAHPGDAGLDIFSNEEITLKPGEYRTVKTGIAIELPPSTEAQVRPRSGLASKHGITVLNSPGTIDEGYRGEICVIMINHSKTEFKIEPGMKIAQMIVSPVVKAEIEEIDNMSETKRGEGGFGSTGL